MRGEGRGGKKFWKRREEKGLDVEETMRMEEKAAKRVRIRERVETETKGKSREGVEWEGLKREVAWESEKHLEEREALKKWR